MTKAEKKLDALKKGKNKMGPYGSRTSEVKTKVSDLKTALQEYIKSDNISISTYTDGLAISVEEHSDLKNAVYYLNCAINRAQDAVDEEKASAKEV